MGWKIVSINNHTHSVTLGHTDGASHAFIVPADNRERSKKLAYIGDQTVVAEIQRIEQRANECKTNQRLKLFKILKIVVLIETLVLIGMLWHQIT